MKTIGAARIMLGTDYPIFAPGNVLDTVAKADISSDERAKVLSGTARALLAELAQGVSS